MDHAWSCLISTSKIRIKTDRKDNHEHRIVRKNSSTTTAPATTAAKNICVRFLILNARDPMLNNYYTVFNGTIKAFHIHLSS